MTIHDELHRVISAAEMKFRDYEQECIRVTRSTLAVVRDQLGWPEKDFSRLQIDTRSVPQDGLSKAVPGGWFDKEGRYCFIIQLRLGLYSHEFSWSLCREDGAWRLRQDRQGSAITIDPEDMVATVQPLVKSIEAAFREYISAKNFESRSAL